MRKKLWKRLNNKSCLIRLSLKQMRLLLEMKNNQKQIKIRETTMNRHKTLKSAIVIMLLSFVCSSVMAQKDTISRERTNLNESVIITTQFDPVVNEAVKLTENPSIFDTVFEAPSFKYDIINKVFPTRVTI